MTNRRLEIDNYELWRAWRKGTSMAELARQHGIHHNTVRARLDLVEAELRKRRDLIDAVTDHVLNLLKDDRIVGAD